MKTTVTEQDFVKAFHDYGRGDQFTDAGKRALYNFLIELEEGSDNEIELDVIALCCDFSEYESLEEFQQDYSDEYQNMEDIENRTIVIYIDKESFIIQSF